MLTWIGNWVGHPLFEGIFEAYLQLRKMYLQWRKLNNTSEYLYEIHNLVLNFSYVSKKRRMLYVLTWIENWVGHPLFEGIFEAYLQLRKMYSQWWKLKEISTTLSI